MLLVHHESCRFRQMLGYVVLLSLMGSIFGILPVDADAPPQQVVGSARVVNVSPDLAHTSGRPGRSRWSSKIRIDQASFVKLHFVDMALRSGDVVLVRDANGAIVERITGRGPKDAGTFWGLSVFGDTATLEVLFKQAYSRPPFRIDQVIAGDDSLQQQVAASRPRSVCGGQPDFEDAVCYQSDATKWANAQASAGVIVVRGDPATAFWCSGVNISPDNYVLTNQHCVQNQAECDNTEFIFGFYQPGCEDGSAAMPWQSYRCQNVMASSPFVTCDPTPTSLDFGLYSVLGDPSSSFGYATPAPEPITSGEDVYIVQHPQGRPQEIVHGGGADFIVDEFGLRYAGTLDTETGSSGAPIFRETDGKLVGLHQCGGCEVQQIGNRGVPMSGMYASLAPFLCTQDLTLAAVEGTGLQEVQGNRDDVIDPGETWQFTPRLRNSSCTTRATNVTADIHINPSATLAFTLLDTKVSFGSVAPGQTVNATTPVRFRLDRAMPCGGEIAIDLKNIVTGTGASFPTSAQIFSTQVGERVLTTLLSENFASGIRSTWSIVHNGTATGEAATWTTTNPGFRTLGLTAPFAIVDALTLPFGQSMDEQLVSPVLNATGFTRVILQFSHVFNWYHLGQDERGTVDVSSAATGGAWVNVASFEFGDASGTERIDITPYAAGQSDVRVRFHYANARTERWWAIDDIFVLADNGFTCFPFEASAQIFNDNFESGNLSAWSQQSGGGLAMTVVPQAALAGTRQGLQINVNGSQPVYVQDDSPQAESRYRARFYFDATALRMCEPSQHRIFTLLDADRPDLSIFTLALRFSAGQYRLGMWARLDDDSRVTSAFFPITRQPHFVEVHWDKASGPGAKDGAINLWIDNRLVASHKQLNNANYVVDSMRLGAVEGIEACVNGTMYFDEVRTQRDLPIGP